MILRKKYLFQVLTKKGQERGSSTETNEADKIKEQILEVSDRSCTKGMWKRFFEATGDISFSKYRYFKDEQSSQECVCSLHIFFRNLGPAYNCPGCHRGLRSPRRCFLRHGRLILNLSLITPLKQITNHKHSINKGNIAIAGKIKYSK